MLATVSSRSLSAMPSTKLRPKPYNGPSLDQCMKLRSKFLSPALIRWYKDRPLLLVDGKMQFVWDDKGKRYLDLFAGICTVSVGHCHPEVNKAMHDQIDRIHHVPTIYLNDQICLYAEELAKKMPGDLKSVYVVNSGSEATDLAMLMARDYSEKFDIIALRNCYHGMSIASMGLVAHQGYKHHMAQGFGIHHALNPNRYTGPYGYDDPDAGKKYAEDVRQILDGCTPGGTSFIAETFQGVGGTVELPQGYLKSVYEMIRARGGVCIADEVQSGFGRVGSHFWGFQTQGVMPDIVTMAKGIGGGVCLAAVVTTPKIAEKFAKKWHINTFGGNPISCSAGRAVLRVLENDRIQQKATQLGEMRLKAGLKKLADKYDIIGDVRGRGYMLGVEMVKDRQTKVPASAECLKVVEMAKEKGLIIGKGGAAGNTIRIKPPMCLTAEDIDWSLEVLDECFANL